MTVNDIVDQFTHDDFTLIIYDLATEEEIYNGPAGEVYFDPIGDLEVVSMDPPDRAWVVTLNVETTDDDYLD